MTMTPAVAAPVAAPGAVPVAMPVAAPKPGPYRPVPVLSRADLNLINRFTGGFAPTIRAEIRAAGGAAAYFSRQLTGAVPDTFYQKSLSWWPALTLSTAELVRRNESGTEGIWEAVANYERWGLVRRIHSERQVQEVMTQFWEHHLHVPAEADAAQYFRIDYGRKMRALALTSFARILTMATTHPAMGCYLDNAESTKKAPNENLGRELLELHTVGRDAGYGEAGVKASARILTGYRVDTWNSWKVYYDPRSHATGRVSVLGFSHANADPDGRAVTRAYLRYLAHHPATARRIARKLAVRFVSDDPPQDLVDRLAGVYLKSGTAIVPVLRALVASAEFAASAGRKMRTPEEDVVASYRALGARISAPKSPQHAANAMLWNTTSIGMRPFGWPRPDGRPDDAASWTSVSRMLASFAVHENLAGGWWPVDGVRYIAPIDRLPVRRLRFDDFVDHLSRTVLGRPATATLVTAACQATGCAAGEKITATHELIRWKLVYLLQTLLDSPTHMTR